MGQKPPSRQLTVDELGLHFKEQTIFLINSCENYDADWMDGDSRNSYECEFKRIATTLRVLLYDYGKSISLFKHLRLKNSLFYNTSAKIDDNNIAGGGLTVLSVGGRVPNFWFPKRSSISPDKLDFDKWWSNCVLRHSSGKEYSRLDLIKLVLS
jgi:hypothetical protein